VTKLSVEVNERDVASHKVENLYAVPYPTMLPQRAKEYGVEKSLRVWENMLSEVPRPRKHLLSLVTGRRYGHP